MGKTDNKPDLRWPPEVSIAENGTYFLNFMMGL